MFSRICARKAVRAYTRCYGCVNQGALFMRSPCVNMRLANTLSLRLQSKRIGRYLLGHNDSHRVFSSNAWEQHQDDDGNDYWFNTETGEFSAASVSNVVIHT